MQPLVLSLDRLPAEGDSFSVHMGAEEVEKLLAERAVTGLMVEGDLSASVRVMPSGSDVFCLGDFEAKVAGPCSRCLEPVARPVTGSFHLTYVRQDPGTVGNEHELHREDLDTEYLTGDSLDLNEMVVEQFLLELPDHLLCSDECRGLCPSCGANRNFEECQCVDQSVDPRFAVLAALRQRGNGAESGSGS